MATSDPQAENVLATWIHVDSAAEESSYPQVGSRSASTPFQNTYWRCVATFFATASRADSAGLRRLLYTNSSSLPTVDGLDLGSFLSGLGVEVKTLPFTYKPPDGYYPAWRNQFYVLDIVKDMPSIAGAQRFVVLDSDCLIVSDLGGLYSEIDDKGVLLLGNATNPDWRTNGLNAYEMKEVFEELDGVPMDHLPRYYDGELFAASRAGIEALAPDIDPVWATCLERHQAGKLKFNEEAHFLSYLYHRHRFTQHEPTRRVRRIWTQRPYSNTKASDIEIDIWHLPAEKTRGIRRVFDGVRRPHSWFWTLPSDSWRKELAEMVGIGGRRPVKRIHDLRYRLIGKLDKLRR